MALPQPRIASHSSVTSEDSASTGSDTDSAPSTCSSDDLLAFDGESKNAISVLCEMEQADFLKKVEFTSGVRNTNMLWMVEVTAQHYLGTVVRAEAEAQTKKKAKNIAAEACLISVRRGKWS